MRNDTMRIIFIFSIVIFLAGLSLVVSQRVQNTKSQIAKLEKQTKKNILETKMLRAEFAYLTRPSRLNALMNAYEKANGADEK